MGDQVIMEHTTGTVIDHGAAMVRLKAYNKIKAQIPLLEGSCLERSLDWRQEKWEIGWTGSQHYCGTAGERPTE